MPALTVQQIHHITLATTDQNQRLLLQSQIQGQLKDKVVAYILGALFGFFGVHRMYCGQIGLGILQFILCCFIIGIFWVLADVFLTSGVVDRANDAIVADEIAKFQLLQ